MTIYIIKLGNNYGFVADDRKARRGAFFHANQLVGVGFKDLKVGMELTFDGEGAVDMDGERPAVKGSLTSKEHKELLEQRAELAKKAAEKASARVAFYEAFRARYGHAPSQDHATAYERGGFDAVQAMLDEEKRLAELREPPARTAFTKAPVPRLDAPSKAPKGRVFVPPPQPIDPSR